MICDIVIKRLPIPVFLKQIQIQTANTVPTLHTTQAVWNLHCSSPFGSWTVQTVCLDRCLMSNKSGQLCPRWKQLIFTSTVATVRTAISIVKKQHFLPARCVCVFCVDLRTNSDYFSIQHWLTGFYNRERVCLLRGTDWILIYNSTFCPTQCIYVFCVDLRTNSDYFLVQKRSPVKWEV